MGKAIIKTTSTQSVGSAPVGVTITPPGGQPVKGNPIPQPIAPAPPYGQPVTGTLQDVSSGAIINYNVSFGTELGLTTGAKVTYNTVTVGGAVVANVVKLLNKGEIMSINATDDGGTLEDKATGATLPFAQENAAETPLVAPTTTSKGTMVHFETIVDPNSGNVTAVAIEVVG